MLSNTDRPSDGTVDAEPEPELESTTFSPSTSSLKGFFSISLLSIFILTSTTIPVSDSFPTATVSPTATATLTPTDVDIALPDNTILSASDNHTVVCSEDFSAKKVLTYVTPSITSVNMLSSANAIDVTNDEITDINRNVDVNINKESNEIEKNLLREEVEGENVVDSSSGSGSASTVPSLGLSVFDSMYSLLKSNFS